MLKKIKDKAVLWTVSKGFSVIIAIMAGLKGRRMSHNKGVAMRGKVKIVPNPTFPKNEFFVAGKEFPCRVRFASVSFEDSAMPQIRGVSIKFSDNHFKSPYDMNLNTGLISVFWTVRNFFFFASKRDSKHGIEYTEYYKVCPGGLAAARNGVRVNPSSFAQMYYYSQTPTMLIDTNGKKYYVTYRMIPEDRGEDSGFDEQYLSKFNGNERVLGTDVDTTDRAFFDKNPQLDAPSPGRNILENEIPERLKQKGKVIMHYQIQFREVKGNEDPEIFNSNKYWDHKEFPFHDLATIELTEVLNYEEGMKTGFSVSNYPKSLPLIPADSIDDYNSLMYIRAHDGFARRVRLFAYNAFGVPKMIEDKGVRNRMVNDKE